RITSSGNPVGMSHSSRIRSSPAPIASAASVSRRTTTADPTEHPFGGSAAGAHEHRLEGVVVLDDVAGAEYHCFERHVRHAYRYFGLALDPLGEAAQQPTAADEVHAPHEEVL